MHSYILIKINSLPSIVRDYNGNWELFIIDKRNLEIHLSNRLLIPTHIVEGDTGVWSITRDCSVSLDAPELKTKIINLLKDRDQVILVKRLLEIL